MCERHPWSRELMVERSILPAFVPAAAAITVSPDNSNLEVLYLPLAQTALIQTAHGLTHPWLG